MYLNLLLDPSMSLLAQKHDIGCCDTRSLCAASWYPDSVCGLVQVHLSTPAKIEAEAVLDAEAGIRIEPKPFCRYMKT